ncbi:hypothetical protein IFM89_036240 [Coptis chinensis]|uniref:Protein kinase domain-containing protein n=1 Tax=Coptis chinensis TaxID=261450 RepID=A0A835HSI2_9MAGN|nr:hypothetical protein IFM89_036240 [Coptis chinensis]
MVIWPSLELAHGHAPFSKYPPMKFNSLLTFFLCMTLQNAPPGLDYERDKRFTKSFKEMVAACLVKDPKKRPSAEKLLKHHFFKQACPHEYLTKTILDSLPALVDRFRQLKTKEANFLVQNKAMYGDKKHLSQIQDFDEIPTDDLDNKHNDGYDDVCFSEQLLSPIKANGSDSAPKQEDELNDLQNVEDSLASFPTLPLRLIKFFFSFFVKGKFRVRQVLFTWWDL